VDKALFTITCTTCKARLAVRSADAVGAILECPKCESMVQVVPPDGWMPAEGPAAQPPPAGPPPLNRVADCPLTLELEPAGGAAWRIILLWTAGLVATSAVVVGLWLAMSPQSPVEQADEAALVEKSPAAELAETASPPAASAAAEPAPPAPTLAEKPETPPPPAATDSTKPEASKPQTPSMATDEPMPPAAPPPTPLFPPAAEEPAAPTDVRKLPPPRVDAEARMSDAVEGLELNDYPLGRAIDLLSGISAVPIALDPDALEQLGVSPRDAVSLRLEATTVGEALRAMLAKRGLAVEINGSTATVTLPASVRQSRRAVRYTIADLTGEDAAAAERLAELVRRFVAPESWREQGGTGVVAADRQALSVEQTDEVQRQVLAFCEKLRAARGLPLRSRESPERFTLKTRAQIAAKTLDRPVTCNFRQPAPLARILAFLSESSGAVILVDHAALAAAGTSAQVEAALVAEKQSLRDALDALLRPLGLAWRAVGAEMIQITTPESLEEHLELEFHPLGRWLDGGIEPARLVEQLKARVGPTSWSDVDGPAEVYFDPPSRMLLVLQSQPAQREIERLLAGSLPNK
jgi:hypothetical protein